VKKARYIFLGVGVLILFMLFKTFGLDTTLDHITRMGWRFGIIVVIFLFNNIFLAYGWRVLITYPLNMTHFFRLIAARIAGDSTSSLNAMAAVAGEPLKAMYVKDILPFKIGLATVVLDRTIHTAANMFMVLTGVIVSMFILELPVYISVMSLLIVIGSLFLLFFIIKKQREGFVKFLIEKMPPFLVKKFMTGERWEKVRQLDSEIAFVLSSRETLKKFYISLTIHYVSIIVSGTLEIYFIVIFIEKGNAFPVLHGMFVYIFGFILTSAMFFMPANVGTSEGSYSLALKLLGHDPALGLSVGIIRRLRTFVWSGIGIALLFYAGLIKGEKKNDTEK